MKNRINRVFVTVAMLFAVCMMPIKAQIVVDTVEVTATSFLKQLYVQDNDWLCRLIDNDRNEYQFDIIQEGELVFDSLYTDNDMIKKYTGVILKGVPQVMSAATFRITQTNSGDNITINVDATLTTQNRICYHITYQKIAPPPSEDIPTPMPYMIETTQMPFQAYLDGITPISGTVNVGWFDNNADVYIEGLFADFPNSCIHGVLKDNVVTFRKGQYLGMYENKYEIRLFSADQVLNLQKLSMNYDSANNIFTTSEMVIANASTEMVAPLVYYTHLIIGAQPTEWSAWEPFAPFGVNTGTWQFKAEFAEPTLQDNIEVFVRTDLNNSHNKQLKLTRWGEPYYITPAGGTDLIINWNDEDNTCSIADQPTGFKNNNFPLYVHTSEQGQYDATIGKFTLPMEYYYYVMKDGKAIETFTIDNPISRLNETRHISDRSPIKYIQSGHLFILRNNERYSIMGAKLTN